MAVPDERGAMAATESGKIGAMKSTWRKRRTLKLHTPGARACEREEEGRGAEEPDDGAKIAHQLAQPRRRQRAHRGGETGDEDDHAADLQRIRERDAERRQHLGQDRGEEEHLGGAGEDQQTYRGYFEQRGPARAPLRRGLGPRGGRSEAHDDAATPEEHAAEEERLLESDARGRHRAHRRPQHLPQRHRGLDGRDVAAHVPAGPLSRHDEGEGRGGAHEPQEETRAQHLGERAGERHQHEADPLQELHHHVEGLGIAASGQPARDGRDHHGDERADAQDPSSPSDRGHLVQRAQAMDVEGQAHVDEGPGEGPHEHRERHHPSRAELPVR